MSTTPRTDAARGFHDMDTAVSAEDMAKIETELARLRADLERFTGHGLLDCHAICDQRDAAVAERDQLRAEVERLTKHCSALEVEVAVLSEGLSEDHAIYIANARAEKAEADLAAMTTCAKKLNEECELWEIRCGSIICSGVLDSYTGADLQKWEDEFKKKQGDLIARAEKTEAELAEWSRLKAWGGTPEIVHKFIKGQQNRIHYCQDLETELAKAEAESLEQARLLGISGSREAALLSEIECLKKIVAESQQLINTNVNKQDL